MAPWIQIAGRLIYNYDDRERFSVLTDSNLLPDAKQSGASLWLGKPRFSKERWKFWKDRLRWIALQTESLLQRTRSLAVELADEMDEIERHPQTDFWKEWVKITHDVASCRCERCVKEIEKEVFTKSVE